MPANLEHFEYLSDRVKLDRYQAAIGAAVKPGQTVLDLGCGTGVLGLMALRAGAAAAWFVDDGAVIEIARRTIAEAGYAGQAKFFRANSFELVLPERADVIVCDHVGFFGFDYGILELLADAKLRFLGPGGVLVPAEIDLLLAPVGSAACRQFVGQWRDGGIPGEYGWVGESAANTKHAASLAAGDLVAPPATLATLVLGEDAAPYYAWPATFECARAGSFDGLAGFFDCRLHGDVRMTNSPAAAEKLNRPQAFLPLDAPIEVRAGDEIRATVMARPADNVIAWTIEMPGRGLRVSHSTFNGLHLDAEMLARVRPDRAAKLNDRGRARQAVLACCDGTRTVAEVQELVRREHPDLFPSAQAIEAFVRDVLARDTGG